MKLKIERSHPSSPSLRGAADPLRFDKPNVGVPKSRPIKVKQGEKKSKPDGDGRKHADQQERGRLARKFPQSWQVELRLMNHEITKRTQKQNSLSHLNTGGS